MLWGTRILKGQKKTLGTLDVKTRNPQYVFFLGGGPDKSPQLSTLVMVFLLGSSQFDSNVTPPLLIVPSVMAMVFRNSGSCDCFGVLDCGKNAGENPGKRDRPKKSDKQRANKSGQTLGIPWLK